MQDNGLRPNSRRRFLGTVATSTAAFSLATLAAPLTAGAKNFSNNPLPADDPDQWFNQVKGKHRIVFDATGPHEIFPFAWPRVFLMTNASTGTPEKDNSVVVILRHEAMPYALEDKLWEKYHFGDMFKIQDPATKTASVRNPFWKPQPGTYKVPGIGNVSIGINELQESGVMFCVCNAAMTVYSAAIAEKSHQEAATVLKEFQSGVLPGIQVVPSGVWAVGRAQEHGCAYCFVG